MKWVPFDGAAFLEGVIGLNAEERGFYITLIALCYARAPRGHVTDDLVCKAMACRPQMWRRVKTALMAAGKVRESDAKLTANRVETTIETQTKLPRKGGSFGVVSAPPSEENQQLTGGKPKPKPKPKEEYISAALPPDSKFEEFWQAYPRREGSNPKAPAKKLYLAARRNGFSDDVLVGAARRYAACIERDKTEPRFVAQAVTWLRQQRWGDYAAEPDDKIAWLEEHRRRCLGDDNAA